MDEHPGIGFVDGAMGRRATLLGTGLDVWEVVQVAKDNDGDTARTAAYLEIDPRLVGLALGYYGAEHERVDSLIARIETLNQREEDNWRAARKAISA